MPDQNPVRKRLFDRAEVATMLDVSLRQLARLKDRGILPEPVDAGGPKWTERDIDEAIRKLEIEREAKSLAARKFGPTRAQASPRGQSEPDSDSGVEEPKKRGRN
jgi:hypothetical protein